MTSKQAYELSFDLNVLHHLGVGLYSNIPAILSEMVANSWDSGATKVTITIGTDHLIIEDNGTGMSPSEINERFLRIGYQKRRETPVLLVNGTPRRVMGRKGIGKLSALSIANVMEILTSKDGQKSGFSMSRLELEKEIENGSIHFYPTPIDATQLPLEHGTRVILRDLTNPELVQEQQLRTNLARRFSVINREKQFEVIINGSPVTLKDRDYYEKIEFMWYFGSESEFYVKRCSDIKHSTQLNNVVDAKMGYRVFGWIATISKPKDIEDHHHTVAIFANGKLIQEDMLSEMQDARYYRQYIIGEIDADFMDLDEEDDIVTSDRQRINQTDPRYLSLKEFVSDVMARIGRSWTPLRNKYGEAKKRKATVKTLPPNSPEQVTSNPGQIAENRKNISDAPTDSAEPMLFEGTQVSDRASSQSDLHPSPFERPVLAPSREAETLFNNTRRAIETSALERDFKSVILYDLEQARKAYYCQAYKACVVMMGAVLEGLMLGRLRQSDMLERIVKDINLPKQIGDKLGGMQNPGNQDQLILATKLTDLGFEYYRQLICRYIPDLQKLGVENIQRFRNSIHPWNSIKEPTLYHTTTTARAMAYLGALETLTTSMLSPAEAAPASEAGSSAS